jgi:glycolate oxidase
LTLGGKAIKNVTGYDLKSLFIGSEGTLGIVTKALLKLIAMPKRRQTLRIMFGSLDDGCRTVHQLLRSGTIPAAAEIMDRLSLEAVARNRSLFLEPETAACLIVEIDGEDEDSLTGQAREVTRLAKQNQALSLEYARSEAEAEELWALRRGASSALAALAPNRVSEDISVPRDSFPEMVRRIQNVARQHKLVISVYGHAGDGNLHPSILCNLGDPEESGRVESAIEGIFTAAIELGGTLSGEHGIGLTKRPYLSKALGAAEIETMKEVKQALDPKGILNPGKIW